MTLKKRVSLKRKTKKKEYPQRGGDGERYEQENSKLQRADFNFESPSDQVKALLRALELDPTNRNLENIIPKTLEQFDATASTKKVLKCVKLHGSYFDSQDTINYFVVPPNTIICVLQTLGNSGLSFDYNQILTDQKDFSPLINAIFEHKSKLSDYQYQYIKDQFKFKYESFHTGFDGTQITDLFQNASWYYPGQFCHNAAVSASLTEIKNGTHNITDFELEGSRWNLVRKHISETELPDGKYRSNLHQIVLNPEEDFQSQSRIIIVFGCMLYYDKLEHLEKVIEYDHSRQITIRENINTKINTGTDSITVDLPELRYANFKNVYGNLRYNYIDVQFYLNKSSMINTWDKRYRILDEFGLKGSKEDKFGCDNKNYVNFLRAQSIIEIFKFIDELNCPPGLKIIIINYIFDEEYLRKETNCLSKLIYKFLLNTADFNKQTTLYNYLMRKRLEFEHISQIRIDKTPLFNIVEKFIGSLGESGLDQKIRVFPSLEVPISIGGHIGNRHTISVEGNVTISDNSEPETSDMVSRIVSKQIRRFEFLNNSSVNSKLLSYFYTQALQNTNYTVYFFNCKIDIPNLHTELLCNKTKNIIFEKCTIPHNLDIGFLYYHIQEVSLNNVILDEIEIMKSKLQKLEIIDLYRVRIIKLREDMCIESLILKKIPLKNLNQITSHSGLKINKLSLSENPISDLKFINDFKTLTVVELSYLYVSGTQVEFKFENKNILIFKVRNVRGIEFDFNGLDASYNLSTLELHNVESIKPIEEDNKAKIKILLDKINLQLFNCSNNDLRIIKNET